MQIRCPHCRYAIDVMEDASFREIECPLCGIHFNLVGDDETTESYVSTKRTIAHFQLLERLGIGHFGSVWKAKDSQLDRIVAIKVPRKEQLDEKESDAFWQDAKAAARLSHPNIVAMHEIGRDGDTIYIVMEYVEGADLKDWLRGQPLPPSEAAGLLIKIAKGVHHAHEHGVIHRDLKPANVMMDREGEPHLLDFGLAKREADEITISISGAALGTPAYMSPEQASGKAGEADARSDVYSLGVMLYEMLTGTHPFHGEKRMLILQILEDEPPPLRRLSSQVAKDLETICLKCLRKEPDRRYQSASELAADLQRFLKGEPIKARPVGRGEKAWLWCRRNWRVVSAVFLAVVVLATAEGAYLWQSRSTARALLGGLKTADADGVMQVIRQLEPHRRWVQSDLEHIIIGNEGDSSADRRIRMHARLALLSDDPSQAMILKEILMDLTEPQAAYVGVLVKALEPFKAQLTGELRSDLRSPKLRDRSRFHAGVALAQYDPTSKDWREEDFHFLAQQLVAASLDYQSELRKYLRPVQRELLAPLEALFTDPKASEHEQLGAAYALAEFSENDGARLARMLGVATPAQYKILYPSLARPSAQANARSMLHELVANKPGEDLAPTDRVSLGRQRAGAAITLLRQGAREEIFDALRVHDDPESLTQFAHGCRARGVQPKDLLECLAKANALRQAKPDPGRRLEDRVMFGLLLSLGEYELEDIPQPERQPLIDRLTEWHTGDPSSAIHGATGWLLRQWGFGETARTVEETPFPYSPKRDWFTRQFRTTESGQERFFCMTFVVFPPGDYEIGSRPGDLNREFDEGRHTVRITRPFAILDREITLSEFLAFNKGFFVLVEKGQSPDQALGQPCWYDSVRFCRWLTEQAGMEEHDQPYADPEGLDRSDFPRDPSPRAKGAPQNWPLRLDRKGFRLPTEAEWEIACRAGAVTGWSCGHDSALLSRYAWVFEKGDRRTHAPRMLRPNLRGLFDMHGNVAEWCHDYWQEHYEAGPVDDPMGPLTGLYRTVRGASWNNVAEDSRSSNRIPKVASTRSTTVGFRVALVPTE